jgi:hypothetical protein
MIRGLNNVLPEKTISARASLRWNYKGRALCSALGVRNERRASCGVRWRTLVLLLATVSFVHAVTPLPYYEDFTYADGTQLAGTNGWHLYTSGPGAGVLPVSDHGWLGWGGGTAAATNGDGRVAGVSLLNTFGAYTGEPGTGWPDTTGEFENAPVVSVRYELDPASGTTHTPDATTRSKFGTMYTTTSRWHYENPGTYYKMMTAVRYFVKTNGLISAYNGHRIKHLTHTPITNRVTLTVTADYTNHVWSLWVDDEQVVADFTLYKTHQGGADASDVSPMLHDGWYKDYDGLKEVGFIDATTNSQTLLDKVRVFEGTPADHTLPFVETFESRVVGGETITMTPGDLNGQNGWFSTDAALATAAQSSEGLSVGSNGVAVSGGGECFQLFLDGQTNVWTDLWLKPLAAGSGDTTVDAGGEDAVFWIDSTGDVHVYDGESASVVTNVVPAAWSRFSVHSDYGAGTWSLLVDGVPVVADIAFLRAVAGDRYEELRVSASGSALAYVDDLAVVLTSPFALPTVSFHSDAFGVGEGITEVTVTVMLSHAHLQAVSVDYILGPGGTATHVDDYSASDGTLIFAPGETNRSFSFTIVDDLDNEEDETLFFSLTNIINAATGSYLAVTYTIESDPADWSNIPFYEPFEDRSLGDLHGQHGWTATHTTVQTNDTYAGSKAAQAVRLGARHAHAFTNGLPRVLAEWRAKPVFARHPPTPPDGSTYAFYVSTNGHLVAFNGTTPTDMGIYTTLNEGEWAHFKVYSDHASATWDLHVNDELLGQGLAFYSAGTGAFSEFGVVGPVVIDEVDLQFPAPVAPAGLAAQAGDGIVDLSWGTAIGADLYRIKRATVPGGPYSALATLSETHCQDISPLNDTTYYYVVSALNDAGQGENSTEASATPRAVIMGLSGEGGFNLVDLSWEAYAGATHYILQRANVSGGPYATIVTTNGTSYQDTVVVNENTYYYILTAVTPGYQSPASDEVAATPDLRTIFYDSFEDPDISGRSESEIPGWTRTRLDGNSDTRAGLWDEDTTSMVTPFGSQSAWVWFQRQITTTNITEALASNATYRLTFNTAAEYGFGGIEYYVELLAGTNILGVSTSGWDLDTYDFTHRSGRIDFTVPTNHPAIGQALGVRLKFVSGSYHYVIGYDNVRLATDDANAVEVAGEDTTPPAPDPMTFAAAPAALDDSRVRMTATVATDEFGPVTYLFENTSNSNVRTWSTNPSWTETGLTVGETYGYRAKSRDAALNETGWSGVSTATPQHESDAPTPNPMTFAVSPRVLDQTRIVVTASIASDPSVPVEYTFENTTNGNVRGWSTSTIWTNTGLTEGQAYGYQVKARDAWSNETAWSSVVTAVPTHENDPPLPSPMVFSVAPAAVDQFSMAMTAAPAIDDSGPVEYMFENLSNGNERVWSTDRVWTNTSLALGETYSYRVKARDVWSNETAWSAVSVMRTKLEIDPPTPDPMTFVSPPTALDQTRIAMTATTATDLHGPVLYRFENMTNGNTRGWSTSALWTDSGLLPGQTHGYRVQARDAELNLSDWSAMLSATTLIDTNAPDPDPMTFALPPVALDRSRIAMTAATAVDVLNNPVQYFFENTNTLANSGWTASPAWTNTGLTFAQTYGYRVKARDTVSNETAWSAVTTAIAEDVLFYESFEDPVVAGNALLACPRWAPSGRGYQWNEDSGSVMTPYGAQVASVFLGGPTSWRLETTGITDVLVAGTRYALSFSAGNLHVDNDAPVSDNRYTVELLAGATTVASATGVTSTRNMSESGTTSFTPTSDHPGLGQALTVRLMMTAGNWRAHALFDNVRLAAVPDETAPAPDPVGFETAPFGVNATSIVMTAGVATDETGPVSYYMENTNTGASSSWLTNRFWRNTGLVDGNTYGYRLKARDAVGNETAWSAVVSAVTTNELSPPLPDPMHFVTLPSAVDETTIAMTATTADDTWNAPCEYYFVNTSNGNNSGWILGTSWSDTNLATGVTYGYRVQARDAVGNETGLSPEATAAPAADSTPPSPNPMGFEVLPTATDAFTISMTASNATDFSPPVQYDFLNVNNGANSGWSTNRVWTNGGLTPGDTYDYRVMARDALSNETAYSAIAVAVAEAPAITIFSESFENPPHDDVTGFAIAQQDSQGWVRSGAAGLLDESSGYFATSDGSQVAAMDDSGTYTTSGNLTDTLQASVQYDLTFNVASRNGGSVVYQVELHAGAQVLGRIRATVASTNMADTTGSIRFTAPPNDPNLGEILAIRLTHPNAGGNSDEPEIYYDNVRLTTTGTGGDSTPPTPAPLTWVVEPEPSKQNGLTMVASTVSDLRGVQYCFSNVVNGTVSGWQDHYWWTDTNLTANATYRYRVKARDNASSLNETAWSAEASGTVDAHVIFYEGFENPMVYRSAGMSCPGWLSNGTQKHEDGGLLTTPYGAQVGDPSYLGHASRKIETSGITNVLTADYTYTLTFNVGNVNVDNGLPRSDNRYVAELIAGSTVVTSVTAVTSTDDLSETNSLVLVTGASHANLGEALKLRFYMSAGDYHAHPLFDNVRLRAAPVVVPPHISGGSLFRFR